MRQRYSHIVGTEKHDKILTKRREQYAGKKTKSCSDRILKFTTLIQEGPYYVCAVCNRCLYHGSVILFNIEKYAIDILDFYREVMSSAGKVYICLTCLKKLQKSEIPTQAVWNKSDTYEFPDDLANLNRLEKAIIPRRILFIKVTIMPKGQMPKIKGSICNVPIDTANVANTLLQGADSNGIVMIKLKRKLVCRGHVYFEHVSPEVVRSALQYLKSNNPLYHDILIDVSQIPENLLS